VHFILQIKLFLIPRHGVGRGL